MLQQRIKLVLSEVIGLLNRPLVHPQHWSSRSICHMRRKVGVVVHSLELLRDSCSQTSDSLVRLSQCRPFTIRSNLLKVVDGCLITIAGTLNIDPRQHITVGLCHCAGGAFDSLAASTLGDPGSDFPCHTLNSLGISNQVIHVVGHVANEPSVAGISASFSGRNILQHSKQHLRNLKRILSSGHSTKSGRDKVRTPRNRISYQQRNSQIRHTAESFLDLALGFDIITAIITQRPSNISVPGQHIARIRILNLTDQLGNLRLTFNVLMKRQILADLSDVLLQQAREIGVNHLRCQLRALSQP